MLLANFSKLSKKLNLNPVCLYKGYTNFSSCKKGVDFDVLCIDLLI